jgi:hypothetical protein
MSFDVDGARQAGYSDKDIAEYLAPRRNFNIGGAREAGYSDADIVSYLMSRPAPAGREAVAPSQVNEPPAPAPDRGFFGSAASLVGDAGASLVTGAGSALSGIGGLGGVAGLGYDNMLSRAGRSVSEFGEGLMSPELVEKRQAFSRAIQDAESRGLVGEASAALSALASNPSLLFSMAIEQIPAFVLSGGVGRGASAIGQVAARRAAIGGGEAAEQAILQAGQRAGQVAAVGTAAGLQGGGVAEETYQDLMRLPGETLQRSSTYQELLRTMSPDEARSTLADRAAREAGLLAGGISVGTMSVMPSAERAMFSRGVSQSAIRRALGVGTGEAVSEGIEEGGGRFAQNLAIQRRADEERSLTQGVGGAAATGAVFGGIMGGGIGAIQRPPMAPSTDPGAGNLPPDLRAAIEEYVANRDPVELTDGVRLVTENLPFTAEQFLGAAPEAQERLIARAQREFERQTSGENLPVLDPQGNRDPETANIRVPQSASRPSDELIYAQAGSRAEAFQFERGRGERAEGGITQAEFLRRRADELQRLTEQFPQIATTRVRDETTGKMRLLNAGERREMGLRLLEERGGQPTAAEATVAAAGQTYRPSLGTGAEQTAAAARAERAAKQPLGAFFPLVEGYIAQHVQQYGPSAPVSVPAFQTYVRNSTGRLMPLAQARDILSTYNDPAPSTQRNEPPAKFDEAPFPSINLRAKAKPRPIDRPVSPAPGQGFVLDERGVPVAPKGPNTDEAGRPVAPPQLSPSIPTDEYGFARPQRGVGGQTPQASARAAGAEQAAPEAEVEPSEAEGRLSRRVEAQNKINALYLDKLKGMGDQGRLIRNGLVDALKNRTLSAQQAYAAFTAADTLATLLPAGANHRIQFVEKLLPTKELAEAIARSGGDPTKELQGLRDRSSGVGMSGIITISLSPASNVMPYLTETAAHEAFHVLQDYYGKYDPQFAKLMSQSFRDGMMIGDVDPTIRRKLEQARYPGSSKSYWQVLTESLPNVIGDAKEAQAYVFASLMDASRRGVPMTGLKPAFARFVNFIKNFFSKLGSKLRGEGFQTAEEVLGRSVSQGGRRFDQMAAPTDRDFAASGSQASARQFPGVRPNGDHTNRVSQRVPTAKKATEDALAEDLPISTAIMAQDPEGFARNAALIENYPNYVPDPALTTPEEKVEAFKDHVVRNLLWLFDNTPSEIRDRSRLWYNGARRLSENLATRYNMTDSGVAGVMAVLSPQKDWFQNVSLGIRTIDIYKTKQNHVFDKKMRTKMAEIFSDDKYSELRQIVGNKSLAQLRGMNSDLRLAALAMWVRTYDQTYNSPSYASVSPEGDLGDPVLTGKGAEARVAWGSLSEIGKAISVIEDDSKENISARVGNAHKVRNFFNNILAPDAKRGDVTIDTHAVAAANLRPLSQKAIEVAHGLGTSPPKGLPGASSSSVTGAQGLYGIYADAYREAADMRGVLPREMQSITWEAIRGLFKPAFKRNAKNIDAANKVWQSVREGVITEDEAREQIRSLGGGISAPSWATGGSDAVDDASLGAADDQGHVSGDELPGSEVRPEGAAAAGVGGRGAGEVQTDKLVQQASSALQKAGRNVQASARGDVVTDFDLVQASGTRAKASYVFAADLKSGGYLRIDATVDDRIVSIDSISALQIQKNPYQYDTEGFGGYSKGVRLSHAGVRDMMRRLVETLKKNHPTISEISGVRATGARMRAARAEGREGQTDRLKAAVRAPQLSARSPLASDPAFAAIRDKLTGKEYDRPGIFSDALRRFTGALPGEKNSSALVRTAVNRAAPGWMLDRLVKEKGLSMRSVGLALEVALNNSGRVQMYLDHGPLGYDPKTGDVKVREDVPGLITAIKGRLKIADKREAQSYLVALRERDLRKSGKKGFFNLTDAEITQIISKSEAAHPEWKQMAADIQRINKALLDFAVATGTLDRSKADQLASMFYTPFYRQADEDAQKNANEVVGPRLSDSLTRVKTAFDVSLKGGENPLGDLFENMIRNADVVMKAGMKNVAMRQAAEALEAVGLGRPAKQRETGKTITYRVDGQDKNFEVDDPVLYTALAGAPRHVTNGIYQTMATFAGFFRDMITIAPSFMLANLWRGKIMAYVQEGVPLYANTFDGLRQALQSSTSYKAIAAQTGFGGYTYGMGERDAAAAFEREIGGLGYGPKGLWYRFTQPLQKASEATEMAERIKLYERAKAQGMTDKEAAFQAYLLAPFSRRGMGGGWAGETVNFFVPLVPFLNAKIQGMYRLIENEKGDTQKLWTLGIPKQMLLRGLVVMAASLALAAKNMADEPDRWDKENPDMKFRYDIIYLPNERRILLPRAFEVGSVFGALPVFLLDAWRRDDSRDLSKALTDLGMSTFFFNPIPAAAVPLFGAATNYDFFRARVLETAGDRNKLPEERVNRSTSAIAKLIGEQAGISPIRVQYVLEGYSGTIGATVLAGLDSIWASMGLIPSKPAGAFGDPMSMPAIIAGLTGANRFYRSDDQTASRFVGDFYKIKEMTDQLIRSQNDATESRDLDRLAELRGDAGLPLRLRPMVNQASTQITEINRRMARIERGDLDSVSKADALRPLRERRDMVAQRVVERARQIGAY